MTRARRVTRSTGDLPRCVWQTSGSVFPFPRVARTFRRPRSSAPGLIGYRALSMAGEGKRLGFYGFGAAAHILILVARYQDREVYAFTRPGDSEAQAFAAGLGAARAGGSDESPPEPLDAAIIFAPVGTLVPAALRAVCKGGVVVCAGIHMSDIPSFPYSILWGERVVRSVANLTRRGGCGDRHAVGATHLRAAAPFGAQARTHEMSRQLWPTTARWAPGDKCPEVPQSFRPACRDRLAYRGTRQQDSKSHQGRNGKAPSLCRGQP